MINKIRVLVDFDFLVDLDLALFKFIKDNYYDSEYVNKDILDIENELEIKDILINRDLTDPMSILIPDSDTTDLYFDLMYHKINLLLDYATVYDTYPLLITMHNNASNLDISILCKNQYEKKFIKELDNSNMFEIIMSNYDNIDVDKYDIFYIKYFSQVLLFPRMECKHIYLANIAPNMENDKDIVNINMSILCGDVNIIHTMDLYTDVKYRLRQEHKEINPEYKYKTTGGID